MSIISVLQLNEHKIWLRKLNYSDKMLSDGEFNINQYLVELRCRRRYPNIVHL